VLSGAIKKDVYEKAMTDQLAALGIKPEDVTVTLKVVVDTSLKTAGSSSDYPPKCTTAICEAREYAVRASCAKVAGVAMDAAAVTGYLDSRRRMQLTLARRLRAGNVDIALKITAADDISAKVAPTAFKAAYQTQYASVVQSLPAKYSAVSLPSTASVTAAQPTTVTTATVVIKTSSGASARSVAGKVGDKNFVSSALASANVKGVTVTGVSSTTTNSGTSAPTKNKKIGSGEIAILVVIGCLLVFGGALCLCNHCGKETGKEPPIAEPQEVEMVPFTDPSRHATPPKGPQRHTSPSRSTPPRVRPGVQEGRCGSPTRRP